MPKKPFPFLTAQWRHLVMLNYEIDPGLVQSRLPAGTEIDYWNGRTFVSLVGFRFLQTRVLGVPVPFHVNFDEVNLRFYVRHKYEGEWRRGVVFIKEIVPRTAIALVARGVYNEQYVALPMRSSIDLPEESRPSGSVTYGWKWNGAWNEVSAKISGQPCPIEEGSEAEFITEHYWGYASQRNGSTLEYGVEHPRWNAWRADDSSVSGEVATFYGPEFSSVLQRSPSSAFVADGSAILVRQAGRRIRCDANSNTHAKAGGGFG